MKGELICGVMSVCVCISKNIPILLKPYVFVEHKTIMKRRRETVAKIRYQLDVDNE